MLRLGQWVEEYIYIYSLSLAPSLSRHLLPRIHLVGGHDLISGDYFISEAVEGVHCLLRQLIRLFVIARRHLRAPLIHLKLHSNATIYDTAISLTHLLHLHTVCGHGCMDARMMNHYVLICRCRKNRYS